MGDGYVGTGHDALRIIRQNKKREDEEKAFASTKAASEAKAGHNSLLGFAKASTEAVEAAFKRDTVGLQTREQFQTIKANIEKQVQQEKDDAQIAKEENELRVRAQKRDSTKKKKPLSKLSFADDDEEQEVEAEPEAKKSKLKFGSMGKNPNVMTGFLPDRDRDREERELREKLKEEWEAKQAQVLNELLEVTYSYWNGTGHRRVLKVRKGDTMSEFLRKVRDQLAPDFREMRGAAVDQMLYIKEDLLIPHDFTFQWFILNKARGKSGPLFSFDVHEDIRMINDASKEKDESHAGKVVERHWYDKNKHIFPASRWEVFDPKKDYGSYSIHGDAPAN